MIGRGGFKIYGSEGQIDLRFRIASPVRLSGSSNDFRFTNLILIVEENIQHHSFYFDLEAFLSSTKKPPQL
jgi:hypothetical protein